MTQLPQMMSFIRFLVDYLSNRTFISEFVRSTHWSSLLLKALTRRLQLSTTLQPWLSLSNIAARAACAFASAPWTREARAIGTEQPAARENADASHTPTGVSLSPSEARGVPSAACAQELTGLPRGVR